jgi:hypothetical protein
MMDSFACGLVDKVTVMSDSTRKDWFADRQNNIESACGERVESVFDDLTTDNDLLMEQILDNMNTTPIGQVLKKIAVLPEVSRQKVLRVRRQLTQGRYDLNERLDVALEKVLDDLDF